MNLQKVKEAREAIGKSKQKLFDLCSGKERWHMSIPADQKNDPDIVIMEGLRLAEEYLVELEAEKPEEDFYDLDLLVERICTEGGELWGSETYDGDNSTMLIYPDPELIKEEIIKYSDDRIAKKCAECIKQEVVLKSFSDSLDMFKYKKELLEHYGLFEVSLPDAENRPEEK